MSSMSAAPGYEKLFTLGDYVRKFAPPNENDTDNYVKVVADSLGVSPDTPFHDLDVAEVAKAQAQMEGWNAEDDGKNRGKRNNSPGNLRFANQAGAEDKGGFAAFPDAETGWAALHKQVEIDQARSRRNNARDPKFGPKTEQGLLAPFRPTPSGGPQTPNDPVLGSLIGPKTEEAPKKKSTGPLPVQFPGNPGDAGPTDRGQDDAMNEWKSRAEELRKGDTGDDYRAAGKAAFLEMKDDLTPGEAKRIGAEGARIKAWSEGPRGAAKHTVDKIIENHPEQADLINANRPAFEEYTRMNQAYYQTAAGRGEIAKQLVEEREYRTFRDANDALTGVFKQVRGKLEELKGKLPDTTMGTFSSQSAADPSGGDYHIPEAANDQTVDLFPLPPLPSEVPEGETGVLEAKTWGAMGGALARGYLDSTSFGSQEQMGRAALAFPKSVEATRAFHVIPTNNQAFLEDIGMAFGWAGAGAVGGKVGGLVAKGSNKLKLGKVVKGILVGGSAGATTGFLNPSQEIGDLKGRGVTAGLLGAFGAVAGGGGAKASQMMALDPKKVAAERAVASRAAMNKGPALGPELAPEGYVAPKPKVPEVPVFDQIKNLKRAIGETVDPVQRAYMVRHLRKIKSRDRKARAKAANKPDWPPDRIRQEQSEEVVTGIQEMMDALAPGETTATRANISRAIERLLKTDKKGTEAQVRRLRERAKKLARNGDLEAAAAVREQADYLGRDISEDIARLRRAQEFMDQFGDQFGETLGREVDLPVESGTLKGLQLALSKEKSLAGKAKTGKAITDRIAELKSRIVRGELPGFNAKEWKRVQRVMKDEGKTEPEIFAVFERDFLNKGRFGKPAGGTPVQRGGEMKNMAARMLNEGKTPDEILAMFDRHIFKREFVDPERRVAGMKVPTRRTADEEIGALLREVNANKAERAGVWKRVDQLKADGAADARVLDTIKHELGEKAMMVDTGPTRMIEQSHESAIRSLIRAETDPVKRAAMEAEHGLTGKAPPPLESPGPPRPKPLLVPKGTPEPTSRPPYAHNQMEKDRIATLVDEVRALKPAREAQKTSDRAHNAGIEDRLREIQESLPSTPERFALEREASLGKKTVISYESFGHKFSAEDRLFLHDMVTHHPQLKPFEVKRANAALERMWDADGIRVPQDNELLLLGKVFGEDFVHALSPHLKPSIVSYIAGAMRAMNASDLGSALLNQGVMVAWRHPKIWSKAARANFEFFFNDEAFQRSRWNIQNHPEFRRFYKGGLAMTSISGHEEPFILAQAIEKWAEHSFTGQMTDRTLGVAARGVGKWVKASDRAYSGFSTQLRFDVMKNRVERYEKHLGRTLTDEEVRMFATQINDFTGYGTMWKKVKLEGSDDVAHVQKHFGWASQLLYSPRYQISALKIVNPLTYTHQIGGYNAFARREATAMLLSSAVPTAGLMALMSLHDDVDVAWDPRSADFMKLRVGKTRIDPMRGLGQYPRLAARFLSFVGGADHHYTLSTTGEKRRYGDGKGYGREPWDDIVQTLENKMAPFVGAAIDLTRARDRSGRELTLGRRAQMFGARWTPMFMGDIYDIMKTDPSLSAAFVAFTFPQIGLNTQTYPTDTTQDMDDAVRMLVTWHGEGNKNNATLTRLERAMKAYRKAVREDSDSEKVEDALGRADQEARRVIQWGRARGL